MPIPQLAHEAGKEALIVVAPSLRKLAASLLQSATGNLGNRLKTWASDRHLNRLAQKLHDARMVKTLWSFDQRVDLLTFYYPQRLQYHGHLLKVTSIDDLRSHDTVGVRVVIAGHVGLGKSILARYLTLEDLAKGKKIPLLLELRKLAGKSLFAEIRDSLLLLDIDADKDVVRHLLKTGKLSLVLDGFDEVPLERRQKLTQQIDKIAGRYRQTDIVITSRPDTEIFTLYDFSRADLAPLERKDLEPLIQRLMEDPNDAARLSNEVLHNRPNLLPILVTPLMVTLLVISYRTASEVPAVISDFYNRLFITLLNRHDKSKPGGFNRPRKSTLSDGRMQEMFNVYSFVTLQEGETEMRHVRALDLAKRAARACLLDIGTAEAFIDDVTEITSLLIREGDQVRFAHKSIQEFHAALYIAGLPDDDARKFYERVRSPSNRDRFSEVLEFLEELDSDRYHQYVTIPDTDAFIARLNPPGKSKGASDQRAHFLQEVGIIMKPTGEMEITLMDGAYVVIRPLIERLKASTELQEVLKRVGFGVYTARDALVRMIESSGKAQNALTNAELEKRFLRSVDEWLLGVTQKARRIKKSIEFRANTRSQLLNI